MNLSLHKIVFITSTFFLISCTKDKLPKATEKGANTFGCKVDGKFFKPYFRGGLFNNVNVLRIGNNTNGFGIHAANQETHESVSIEFTFITKPGVYQLRQYPYRGIFSAGPISPGWYTTDSLNTGELIITRCDLANNIYSGKFSFIGKDPNTGKTVKVTDGRFDLKDE